MAYMAHRWGTSIEHHRLGFAVVLSVLAVLVASPEARADTVPEIVSGPNIVGVPQEGQTLRATATYTGDPTPAESWMWQRCPVDSGPCRDIPGATQNTYTLTAADVGYRIRVRLTVSNSLGEDDAKSGETDTVRAAPTPR